MYVGSSVCIQSRLNQHKNSLFQNKHHSKYLQNAWNKHGVAGFVVIVLEEVASRDKLTVREQYWIDFYDSYRNGFNARPTAENFFGMEWSSEQNEARRRSNKLAWANPTLRNKLSDKFKGTKRGVWTKESHQLQSDSLKALHKKNPEWRKKCRSILSRPENVRKRISGVRRSMEDPEIYRARVAQLRKASESPKRIDNLRAANFNKYNRSVLGVDNSDELDELCRKLYSEGHSLREIGRMISMDHKSVSSRLRKLGVVITRGHKKGSERE